MRSVLIAGGTGLIGTQLSKLLSEQGFEVRQLSRNPSPDALYPTYAWDVDKGTIDVKALENIDYIINLAGAGVADKPWTQVRKRLIIDSRVKSNQLLKRQILAMPQKPKAFISSAAVGYYGDNPSEQWVNEEAAPGKGFLPESCIAWEASIRSLGETGLRVVGLRVGIVLSTKGGALPKLLEPMKFGTAPYFGSGQTWYPWIHIDDLCRMFMFALQDEDMQGFFNAVAPNPTRNLELIKTASKIFAPRAINIPAPTFALRLVLGELADAILTGVRASSAKIQKEGFDFDYPELEAALQNLKITKAK
jgi:uncharacterized protein